MKKVAKNTLILLCTVMFLSACQPTPESKVVINKNEGVLESALGTDNGYDPMKVVFPDHWKAAYKELGGRLTVDIDANVSAVHKAYKAVKIKPYLVPIEQANKIIKALCGTTDVYNYDPNKYSKSQIDKMVLELKAEAAKELSSGDKSDASVTEEIINDFIAKRETAPETITPTPYNHTFTDTSEYGTVRKSISVKKDVNDFHMPYLSIENTTKSGFIECPRACISYIDNRNNQEQFTNTSEISLFGQGFTNKVFLTEEAKAAIKTANSLIGEIGAEDRVLQRIVAYTKDKGSNAIAGYRIEYGIKYDGTVLPYCIQNGCYMEEETGEEKEGTFHQPYEYETLHVNEENGKIVNFSWNDIFDTGDLIKENVALMPFEDIMKNIENQLTAKYAYFKKHGKAESIYVNQIVLTYAVEAVKDHPGEYMLVPAWVFCGGNDYGDGFKEIDGTILKGRSAPDSCLLTINAIDGSVVHLQ